MEGVILNRYDRQTKVSYIGRDGQEKISQAAILIIGAGALGSYAAEQLTRSGIKKIILVDPDYVTLTNLQRQTLFNEADVQKHELKVIALKKHLAKINHQVQVIALPTPLSENIVNDYNFDLCLDCTDNFTARDLINNLALKYDFDYIFASCAGSFGNVMAISPKVEPCLNCVFPNLANLKKRDCELIGVLTPLISVVSGLQIALALKYLTHKEEINFKQLISIDIWKFTQTKFKVNKNLACPVCSKKITTIQTGKEELTMLCGSNTYYTVFKQAVDLKKWTAYFKSSERLISASPKFIRFKLHGYPVSLFKNGKLIMYDLESLNDAQDLWEKLKQLNLKFKQEGN